MLGARVSPRRGTRIGDNAWYTPCETLPAALANKYAELASACVRCFIIRFFTTEFWLLLPNFDNNSYHCLLFFAKAKKNSDWSQGRSPLSNIRTV